MCDKLMLSKEQVNAIRYFIGLVGINGFMKHHIEIMTTTGYGQPENKSLNDITIPDMARTLYEIESYEIKAVERRGSVSFYIYETHPATARTCNCCGKGMNEGFLQESSGETYCSHECVNKSISACERVGLIMTKVLFWTDWYDDSEARK